MMRDKFQPDREVRVFLSELNKLRQDRDEWREAAKTAVQSLKNIQAQVRLTRMRLAAKRRRLHHP